MREDTRHGLEPVRGERVLQLLPAVQRHAPGVQAGGSGAAVRQHPTRYSCSCIAGAGARRDDGRATPQRGESSQCHVTLQGGQGLVQRLLMPRSATGQSNIINNKYILLLVLSYIMRSKQIKQFRNSRLNNLKHKETNTKNRTIWDTPYSQYFQ